MAKKNHKQSLIILFIVMLCTFIFFLAIVWKKVENISSVYFSYNDSKIKWLCLRFLPHLQSLNAEGITDNDLIHINGLTQLKHLKLLGSNLGNDFTGKGLSNLEKLVNLTSIDLSVNKIANSNLKFLSQFSKLTSLSLDSTPISDEGMVYIENLSTLKELNISDTIISDIGLVRACLQINLRQNKGYRAIPQ